MCVLFHRWGDWRDYGIKYDLVFFGSIYQGKVKNRKVQLRENRQKRVCDRCGKAQDKKVSVNGI